MYTRTKRNDVRSHDGYSLGVDHILALFVLKDFSTHDLCVFHTYDMPDGRFGTGRHTELVARLRNFEDLTLVVSRLEGDTPAEVVFTDWVTGNHKFDTTIADTTLVNDRSGITARR